MFNFFKQKQNQDESKMTDLDKVQSDFNSLAKSLENTNPSAIVVKRMNKLQESIKKLK